MSEAPHKPGTGRDWTDAEIDTLRRWGEAARTVPYELLAIGLGRTPQALRVKLSRIRAADRRKAARAAK